MEQHRGAGGAEEGPAGLHAASAELPAGVRRDQVPDPGEEESHRRHAVHGQRFRRSPGSAEASVHHGRSFSRPGAQTPASTGTGSGNEPQGVMSSDNNSVFPTQEEAEHLATAHSGRAMEILVPFDGISVEWEELKRTLQGCEDSLMVASRLQSFIQVSSF